jgi:hypothetical protein
MPILVQSADEDAADEAALLARIVALETANTALVSRILALEALTVDLASIRDRAEKADAALASVTSVLAAAYPA